MSTIKSIDDPRYIKAMSHPVRVRIMGMLQERQASPNELAAWLGTSLGATAYHVRTLNKSGLIELVDETRVRGAVEHHYRAKPLALKRDGAGPIARQADVGARLRDIETHTATAASVGGFDDPGAVIAREALTLDDKGWQAINDELRKTRERIGRIAEQSAKRLSKDGEAVSAEVVLLSYTRGSIADQIPQRGAKNRGRPLRRGAGSSNGGSSSDGQRARGEAREVVLAFLKNRDATIAQVSEATGILPTAVRAIARAAEQDRMLEIVDHVKSRRGPAAAVYRFTG